MIRAYVFEIVVVIKLDFRRRFGQRRPEALHGIKSLHGTGADEDNAACMRKLLHMHNFIFGNASDLYCQRICFTDHSFSAIEDSERERPGDLEGNMLIRVKRCLLAALALLLCLAACGPGSSPSVPDNDADTMPEEPVTLSCYINHPWYSAHSFDGIIPGEITRQTGVTLDVTVATDNAQLGVMIATGSLPDLIYSSSMLDRLSHADVSLCYDDLLSEYGALWDIGTDLRSNALTFSSDGRLYTVLNHYSSSADWQDVPGSPMTGSLLIRQDILDALGNPPLRTLEELRAVYGMVRESYPHLIPLVFDGEHRFNVFLNWFGLGTAEFVEQQDGAYRMLYRDSRYYDMLKYLNGLYREGHLQADNFVSEESMTMVPYRTGNAFSYSGCTQNSNVSMNAYLQELNGDFHSVELYPLEGARYIVSDIGWSGTFITTQNSDPETSIRFIAWMFTPEAQTLTQWGREGIDYTLEEDGVPFFSEDLMDSIARNSYAKEYNPWFYFGGSAIVEAVGRYAVLDTADYEQTYNAIRENYENYPWIVAAMPTAGQPEKEIYDKIMSNYVTNETKTILSVSDEEFQENYASYMDYLEKTGVVRLEEFMSRSIAECKPHYLESAELTA